MSLSDQQVWERDSKREGVLIACASVKGANKMPELKVIQNGRERYKIKLGG